MIEKIKNILKLVRWFHELLAILPFIGLYLTINYSSKQANISCQLSGFHFVLLCICVQLLIAAGCILNDMMDKDIDKINKPLTHIIDRTISFNEAKKIFLVMTIAIIALSIYISVYVFKEWAFISLGVYLLSIVKI